MKSFSTKTVRMDKRGIAIYLAVTIAAALVLVSIAVVNFALKQISISGTGRDSQAAFYAADSGVECTLFWDLRNPSLPGQSAFATTTPLQNVNCDNTALTVTRTGATSTFTVVFPPDQTCANITVAKGYTGGKPTTRLESRGYNSCNVANARRVERAILVTY